MFTPSPNVDSCIVVMDLKGNKYPEEFFEFLKGYMIHTPYIMPSAGFRTVPCIKDVNF